MPFITERWPGGMLTNFVTIRKAVKKMATIDRMKQDGTFMTLSKKERLQVDRLRAKLEKNLGSIGEMSRLPAALFVVDGRREKTAIREANRVGLPVVAVVDTNTNISEIPYVIPGNDDAIRSIKLFVEAIADAALAGKAEFQGEVSESDFVEVKEEATSESAPEAAESEAPAEAAPEVAESEAAATEEPVQVDASADAVDSAEVAVPEVTEAAVEVEAVEAKAAETKDA